MISSILCAVILFEDKMKNFTFRHQENISGSGSAVEDLYLNHSSDPSVLFKLQMFIDSRWDKFRLNRETSGSTAFIGLILAGSQLRGEVILHAGDVVIERSRSQQLVSSALPGDELHRLVLIITRTPAFDLLVRSIFPENQTVIHTGNDSGIREIFQAIGDEAAGNGDEKAAGLLIFKLLQELNGRKRSEKYPPSLAKAMEFIRKNGFKMLSCRDIARNAGVSERKLNELFRSFLHTAPAQYLIQRRLNFAGELLASGKFSIKETAVMSGFSTPEFFIRQFKKHTGITPGKYQEKL